MPFTFSHPAIILPLAKLGDKRISTTALIIGSMAPDFEYFINMRMMQVHGHTIAGIFYYNLPLTIILSCIFHLIVRDPLIQYSPSFVHKRFEKYIGYNWITRLKENWFVILYSAIIGISSHLFWDSFTHPNRFFVNHIDFLRDTTTVFYVEVHNYELGQLLSSLVGGIAILFAIISNPFQKINKKTLLSVFVYWVLVLTILLLVLYFRNVSDMNEFIATTISGGLIGLIGASLIIRKIKLQKRILS